MATATARNSVQSMGAAGHTNGADVRTALISRVNASLSKLKYLYEIQGNEFWYMEIVRLTPDDLQSVNEDFVRSLADDFYDLGARLGGSLSGSELTVELYKFNETLTRLFSNTRQHSFFLSTPTHSSSNSDVMSIKTFGSESIANLEVGNLSSIIERTDATLLLRALIKLLMMKLGKLNDLISQTAHKISPVEIKLVDDVLIKNITSRVLRPYHNLLSAKAYGHLSNIH